MKRQITLSAPIVIVILAVCTILALYVDKTIGCIVGCVSGAYILFIYLIGGILKEINRKNNETNGDS